MKAGAWIAWHQNGKKKRHYFHNNGKRDQAWTAWWSNGNKRIEGNYKEGLKNGAFAFWYKNGQKEKEGLCDGDELIGNWIYYNEDGTVKEIKNYK